MKKNVRSPDKRALFFDVNQTLVRQEKSFQVCFYEQWNEFTARWIPSQIPAVSDVWAAYLKQWQKHRKARMSVPELEELQRSCLSQALEELSVPSSSGLVRSLLQQSRQQQLHSVVLTPNAEAALRSMAPRYQLAIISNSPRTEVSQALNKFGLTEFFPPSRIFTPASAAEKKPSSHLFRAAMDAMKLTPRQALMVGNSWKHDVVGAVRAGLDAVWLQTSDNEGPKKISRQKLGKRKVYLIYRLDQLTELFR